MPGIQNTQWIPSVNLLTNMPEIIGHFHPLIVHLPIGLLSFLFLMSLLPKEKRDAMHTAVNYALLISAVCAIAACLTGYTLSNRGEYDENAVDKHFWLGISTAVLCTLSYVFNSYRRQLIWCTFFIMILASHYGGSLTHGENYLFGRSDVPDTAGRIDIQDPVIPPVQPSKDTSQKSSANEMAWLPYEDEVKPILQHKCYQCHSASKRKGGLRLDTETYIVKGGKNGKVLNPTSPENSTLYKHLIMPLDDDKHMPPKGKKQLTPGEIRLIHRWIAAGAPFAAVSITNKMIPPAVPIAEDISSSTQTKSPDTDKSDNASVQSSLKQVDVQPLEKRGLITDQDTRGVSINFVNVINITPDMIDEIKKIGNSIYELKLNGQNTVDDLLASLPTLGNLKKLNLSGSSVSDKGILQLRKFTALEQLYLYETNITDASMEVLGKLNKLRKIYLWHTGVTPEGIQMLRKMKSDLEVESGSFTLQQPDSTKK
jgi:uncharacterized membrane protein